MLVIANQIIDFLQASVVFLVQVLTGFQPPG
jgi:hypothetical protein